MSSSQHSSGHSGSLGQTNITHNNLPSDITKMGYLKKMKTMKKKFFVVRSGSRYNPPRLEYYDTEKKFRAGLGAKRTIDLSQCFSVNKRSDSKHKFGIVVYTKDDSFSVLADNSEERDHWFNEILEAFKEGICDTDHANHHYECVWPVTVQNRGLGNSRLLHGHYRLCLSEEAVCLVKVNAIIPDVTFQLRLIRRCGHTNAVFFMEVGRSSVTGEGELWMGVEDTAMAQTMHDVILSAMKNQSSFRGGSGSSGPITVPQQPQEVPRIRTTSMGSPRRPHVVAEKPRPKSLFTKSPSATTSRSPATPTISHFGTSPLSPLDFPDSGRIRSNSIDSHESHSAVSCEASDSSPVDHHFSGHMGERTVTPEPPQPPGPEYLVMTPGTSASASSSARSSRERLNSMGSSSADAGAIPESYMEMAPGEATSVSSPHLPPDTYMDMSPLAADQAPGISGGDDSYAFMGGYQRGTKSGPSSMKSGQPSYKSGPGSNKSAPGGFKSPPSGYKSGPGSHKSGPASVKSGPSSVKSMSSVEGRDDGYIDMEPGSDTMSPGIDLRSPGYFSMSSTGQSPKMDHMPEMRPDKVYSYLSDDSFSGDTPHVRTYSVGSKTTMTKPTLTYQAYQETVAKQGKLSNSKSSSAPHLIPPKPGRQLQSESPTPPATMSYVNSPTGPMSKSFKSDDSDSFMELDFCRPRTASDCYSYRRRAGSFGQAQTQHNHGYLQNFRERASSYGHSSKPVLLKRISSESVRTTSQELFRKSSMDSLHKGSKESLRSSQESLRKAVLDSRQRGSIQADYMEMSSDKIRSVSEKKPVYISGRKQLKVDESKGVKEYFDMTLGSPTQSHMHVTDPIQQVVTSPVTVKLTAPDTYMEMTPDHGADSKPGKSESSRKEADTLVYGSPPVAGNNVPVNPYVNMSYDSDGNPSKSQPHGMFSSQTANVVHARQSSSPAVLESAPVHSSTDSNKTLSPDAAFYSHKNPVRHHYPKPKSPIPRSPLAEEDRDTYLSFSPGNVTESSSKQSDTKKQPASYHGPKKNSKLSPKSPDILREESDSSYMSFSSDGSLSDSKNSDLCYPRGSHRMRHSHRKSETVREESDGYISFSPVNVQSEDEKKSQDEAKSHKRYHPKFDFKKDAQKSKKAPGSLTKPSTVEEGYMSFIPSVVVDGETEKAFGDTSDNRAKSDFVTGVVSSNIKTWKTPKQTAPNKDDESGYLEFSPVGTSSDKESKSKTSTTASSSENVKASSKKKYSAEYVQQRRARKVSSGSKAKTSPTEAKPPTPLCTEASQKSQPTTTTTSDLASDYANMSLPESREYDTKVVAPITRPIFDPSKVPKSPRSAGNLERGVLKSPRQNVKHGSDKGSQGEKGSNVSTSPLVTGSRASERSRKVSCDSMKGSLGTNPVAAVSQATVSSQGQLPKRGSTPNIPSYADNPGPCAGAVTSMLPGDRHSYSEPSSSDLAVCGGLTPTSGSNSRHSSRTSLNSLAGKETLNYASLDLGSSDNMTSVTEGGITFLSASTAGPASRTRHASGQEPQEAPPFYAQIDFKKCEELKNSKR